MGRDARTDQARSSGVPDQLFFLDRGRHMPNVKRACAMEAASWLAGEPWTDHPRTVHPVIASVARMTNDQIDDADRQALWPLVLASLDTARPRSFRLHRELVRARRRAGSCSGRELWELLLSVHAKATGHIIEMPDWTTVSDEAQSELWSSHVQAIRDRALANSPR